MIALWLCLATAEARKGPATPPDRPIVAPQPIPYLATPGSLWSEVASRQMMGLDGNARQVGDLITVRITESVSTSLGAETKTSRKSTQSAAIRALLGMEKTLKKAHKLDEIGIDLESAAEFAGAGTTGRDSAVEATLTCEVIEVLPNGNLRIWGWKQVRVNRETQFVVVEGVARPRDVQMDNTVNSELLATARVEITGRGVVSDRQGPGFGARLLDALWPF
jgi:flagellar L-ring protein precursor FlgH